MDDLNFSFLVVGSQDMVWESLADDGYVTQHLNEHEMHPEEQSDKIKTCMIEGDEPAEDMVLRVRDILNLARGKQQILMLYVVDSVAIVFALLVMAKYQEYQENIADIQVLNAEGGFDSLLDLKERI